MVTALSVELGNISLATCIAAPVVCKKKNKILEMISATEKKTGTLKLGMVFFH